MSQKNLTTQLMFVLSLKSEVVINSISTHKLWRIILMLVEEIDECWHKHI